ncbi:MAG: hypothetical protein LBM74_01820 [Oscillospiraceae bacterium]|jgi:uncharacterized membrane protein|nr:hypothetical protein [Oscillospiraceae bacterium]
MYDQPEQDTNPNVISTSQAVNLTATLASLSALAALFLCFADQRSRAIRRFSVQSVGLGVVHLAIAMLCWIVSAIVGWLPVVGYFLSIACAVVLIAVTVLFFLLRLRMMFRAYRGEAYVLPGIGESLRRFE